MYSVKQVSDLAGVSVRTLHYYDQIGLLTPSKVGANGYRYYDDAALLRLQQILFYREIGLELLHIKDILDSPDFDLLAALRSHRNVLSQKLTHQQKLIDTLDSTIQQLTGDATLKTMSNTNKKRLFEPFSEETQKQYEREARLAYDPGTVNESIKRWNSYTKAQQEHIIAEGQQIYSDMADAMLAGMTAQNGEVQAILERWRDSLRNFYEPTLEMLRGLGELYNTHPGFIANFQKIYPKLPAYLQETITQYVDDLESAELERMLAEDDAQKAHTAGDQR